MEERAIESPSQHAVKRPKIGVIAYERGKLAVKRPKIGIIAHERGKLAVKWLSIWQTKDMIRKTQVSLAYNASFESQDERGGAEAPSMAR